VKWKKAVGATPQIQTVWKPTKTGAKRKKGEKHNDGAHRLRSARMRASSRARARDSFTVYSVLCENRNWKPKKTRAVSHSGLAIYIKKRIMETQILHHAKNTFFKKSSKRNQNPSRCYNFYN
jgi:hypothetical protein